MEVQAGPGHRQPPQQVGAPSAAQSGSGGGPCRQESGGRAAAGPGRQPWGLPRAPRPSGVATCARNTQSVRLCWGSWEAEGVWLREAKWECGRGRDKDHTCVCVSVGVTDHSPAPFQTQLSRRAQVTPEPGVGACKESHRAPAPPSSVTCRWRRGVHGQPRPPLPPTVAGGGVLGTVMGAGLGTTPLGTPGRGWGGCEPQEGMSGWRRISNSEHWLHN